MTQTTPEQLIDTIVEALQDKKGHHIVIADLSDIESAPTQAFVLCTGGSPQQVEALAGSVNDLVRDTLHEKAFHVAGLENRMWIAIDYGEVMVHIFLPEERDYYDLEHLWDDAKITELPDLD